MDIGLRSSGLRKLYEAAHTFGDTFTGDIP